MSKSRYRATQASFGLSLLTVGLILPACGGVKDHSSPDPAPDNSSAGSSGTAGAGTANQPGAGGASGAAGASGTAGATGGAGGTTSAGAAGAGGAGAGGTAGTGGAGGAAGGAGGAPVPASGIVININGTMVPKEKAIVFVHFGHSNMVGRGTGNTELHNYFFNTQARLWSYDGTQFTAAKERTATEPFNPDQVGGGPGMAWLKAAAALAGPDYHFISVARAQSFLNTSDWQKGGPLYSTLFARIKPLIGKVTFAGAFMMLGVTDRHLPEGDWPGFPARISKLIADLRADMKEPNLPVMACDYEIGATDPTIKVGSPFAKIVQPLMTSLPGKIANLALVPVDDTITMQDDHHFDLAGLKLWSDRGVALMKDKGWLPWAR